MKFQVNSASLLKQLQHISGVINSNQVLPILEDFLLDVSEDKMTVVATDLETVMRVSLGVQCKEAGRVCIPAKILIDSLKNISDQPLTFSVDKKFGIEITSTNGKYKVMGENPDTFPKDPVEEEKNAFKTTAKSLNKAISKTLFATSTDDLRPAMTGVFFELDKKGMQLVATDAHRLVSYRRKDVKCPKIDSFIVPRKPLSLLKSALPDTDDEVVVSYNTNHLFVRKGDLHMSCRLIDARFPDYKVVIPTDSPYSLRVDKNEFHSVLRRINVFSDRSVNQVVLNISSGKVMVSAQNVDLNQEGTERMKCKYDGKESLTIAFNAKFLIEMLGAIDGDEVVISLSIPTKPGIIRPSDQSSEEDVLMLVMPLMITA